MLSSLTNSYQLKPSKLILKSDNPKLKGLKGYIASFGVNVSYGFNWSRATRCVGVDEKGNLMNNELCDEILSLECIDFIENIDIPDEVKEKLDKAFDELIPSIVEPLKAEMDKNSKLPISHIQMLAENEKAKFERQIKDLQKEIDKVKNSTSNDNFGDGLAKNQRINELTEQLFELKDTEFIMKSKINRQTKAKIDEILNKSSLNSTKTDNFMIYFEVR